MKQDFDKISKELNITDEQKQKINELMQADLSKKKELRQQIKQKMNIFGNVAYTCKKRNI